MAHSDDSVHNLEELIQVNATALEALFPRFTERQFLIMCWHIRIAYPILNMRNSENLILFG